MTASAVVSKRATPVKNIHQKQDAQARTRSTSVGQRPRSFEHTEGFLAQKAATAYRTNAAYVAIEKATLHAVAPFLELAKKREQPDSTSESPPAMSRSYAHAPLASSTVSIDLNTSPSKSHRCTVSGSSTSSEGLRSGSKMLSSPLSATKPDDGRSKNAVFSSSPRSIFSSDLSASDFTPETSRSSPTGQSLNRRLSLCSTSENLGYSSPQSPGIGSSSGLGSSTSHQFDLLQSRLQTMSLAPETPRKMSTSTIVPIIAPDPAFLLTKFIHDSVRLYSPSKQEIDEKHRLQLELERILQLVQPTASLVLFGSVKNGLALANADLDLMVMDQIPIENQLHDLHVDLPNLYAEALRSQGFSVKLLTKTRIPLIKILREYVAGAFSVDISFDNPLALHNTRLMATYNACDPRFRILVMFIKLWARARRINDSFAGTLKSYGYMIMLIYFLQNKASPALLPNLQMISPSGRAVSADELECQGFDIWYAKDVSRMHAIQQNSQSVGELIEGFFSHFAYEFDYRDWVISINVFGGLQTKESKRWTQLVEHLNENGSARVKDRFILCVSDPFEISHNVARTVTRAGLYEIRGSMMAAVRAIRGSKLTDLLTPSI